MRSENVTEASKAIRAVNAANKELIERKHPREKPHDCWPPGDMDRGVGKRCRAAHSGGRPRALCALSPYDEDAVDVLGKQWSLRLRLAACRGAVEERDPATNSVFPNDEAIARRKAFREGVRASPAEARQRVGEAPMRPIAAPNAAEEDAARRAWEQQRIEYERRAREQRELWERSTIVRDRLRQQSCRAKWVQVRRLCERPVESRRRGQWLSPCLLQHACKTAFLAVTSPCGEL